MKASLLDRVTASPSFQKSKLKSWQATLHSNFNFVCKNKESICFKIKIIKQNNIVNSLSHGINVVYLSLYIWGSNI